MLWAVLQAVRTALLACSLCVGAAHAASATVGTWYEVDETNGAFSITYKSKLYHLTASPKTHLDDQVWFYNANLVPQDPASIKGDVERQYGLLSGSLVTVATCDTNSRTHCTGSSSIKNTAYTSTFSSAKAFDYLAVHLGRGELLFSWTVPTKTFTLTGLPTASISNYRAFLGPPPQVLATPLPGAALLFGSSLVAAAGIGWKRLRQKDRSASPSAAS